MIDVERLSGLQEHLCKEISTARAAAKSPPLSAEDLTMIVKQVMTSLGGDVAAADLKFYTELEELAHYIRKAKHDITLIRPDDISTDHIPSATNELDAVVGATEEATNKIMDVCDEISAIAGECSPASNEKLVACTTKIFEACNFQDITGQRITKVVETLKHIDVKIEALVKAMGNEINRGTRAEPAQHIHASDEMNLLNGPQLPQNAVSQDEIDRVMAGDTK